MNAFLVKLKETTLNFLATAKKAAHLTIKQAELTKIAKLNLSEAYTELGKHVYEEGNYREEFTGLYENISKPMGQFHAIRQAIANRPKPENTRDKVISAIALAKNIAW